MVDDEFDDIDSGLPNRNKSSDFKSLTKELKEQLNLEKKLLAVIGNKGEGIKAIRESFKGINNLIQAESRLESRLLEILKEKNSEAKKTGITALKNLYQYIDGEKKILDMERKRLDSRKAFETQQKKQIALDQELGETLSGDVLQPLESINHILSHIPIVGSLINRAFGISSDHLEEMKKHAGEAFQKVYTGSNYLQASKEAMKSIGSSLASRGLILLGIGILVSSFIALVHWAWEFNEAMGENARELGLGLDKLKGLSTQGTQLGITFQDVKEAIHGISSALGGLIPTNIQAIASVEDLEFYYGLSTETAGGLVRTSAAHGKTLENVKSEVAGTLLNFEKIGIKGISFQKTLDSISKISSYVKSQFQGSFKELTKAVSQAALFGTTVDELAAAGKQMLNIEQSLTDQYELQVLTGKQFNFDQIRGLSLAGKTKEANTALLGELRKIGDQEFLNPVIAEKYASALGISVDRLTEMRETSRSLNKLGISEIDLANKSIEQLQQIADDAGMAKDQDVAAFLAKQKNVDITRKWERSITLLKESLMPILDVFVQILTPVSHLISGTAKLISGFGGVGKAIFLAVSGLTAGIAALKVFGITASAVQRSVLGIGSASKTIMQGMGGQGKSSGGMNIGGFGKILGKGLKGNALTAGIFGGLELMSNMGEGKPIGESLGRTLFSVGGSLLGGALGTLLGPGGTVAGGIGGGLAGSALADVVFGGEAAAGGIVPARPGGMLINVGEGGKDEKIVPLNQNGTTSGEQQIISLLNKLIGSVNQPVMLQFADGTVQKISGRAGFLSRNNTNIGLG